jgi:hypothetical protein
VVLSGRFDPRVVRRVGAGALSAALHVLLLLAILSGGRHDGTNSGDSPLPKLVLLESPQADRREGAELPPIEPEIPNKTLEELFDAVLARVAPPPADAIAPEPEAASQASESPPDGVEPITVSATQIVSTVAMSQAEKNALSRRMERLAEQMPDSPQSEVTWEENGRKYSAVLVRQRANDGTALEHVSAEVSASDRGKVLTTRINLNRLAFSQFTQMVDYWDPMVQLHDDEIVGRFHSNSQFKLLYDSRTAPKFLGKVTTAARSFNAEANGRRREADIFKGGVETRTEPIPLPETLQPFEWAPREDDARIHELASDTHIRFFADGSYTWRTQGSSESEYLNALSDHPVYFIGARNTTLYVQGVVAGKILIYSPLRIVIEGSIVYATDPRARPESRDYLGLVSDRYVEVASPGVTGPGDVEIDAAIFAGRRFIVTNIDHPRSATLRIYGSLAAGTLSATEPRYATRIDYDRRFEHQRPPGFPSTNRYEVDDWTGVWTEVPERSASDSL